MSTLKVDNLLLQNNTTGTGRILEVVSGVCDGRSITTLSGTYQLENVTAVQLLTTTVLPITGSSITYTPPEGTKTVIYEFWAQYVPQDGADSISHIELAIDDVEVVSSRHNPGPYRGLHSSFKWAIQCNAGAADTDVGSFTSWTSPKELKLRGRSYSTAYDAYVHWTYWWDGGAVSTSQVTRPVLTITAIG